MSLRLIACFMALFIVLQLGWSAARDTWIERLVIDTLTVRPAATLINAVSPSQRVAPDAHRLRAPGASMTVLNGCEGIELLFLLVAAIVPFARPWRHKVAALAAGAMLVFLLNQARIVALWFLLRADRDWFHLGHGLIAPTLLITLLCGFVLAWSAWSAPPLRVRADTPQP